MDRGAFQELDYRRVFGQLAKWVAQIDHADRMHEYVARAFAVAMAGRPGPVVLALPEDMLVETAALPAPRPVEAPELRPSPAQMQDVAQLLGAAKRPLVVVGGSGWTPDAVARLEGFAAESELPVAASFRRQDRFDNAHPCYVGDFGLGANPKLHARFRDADLLLAIGARFGEIPSAGYQLLDIPTPRQPLVHVLPDPDEIGRLYAPTLGIVASPGGFATMLEHIGPLPAASWRTWRDEARADYEAWQTPKAQPGRFDLGQAVLWMRDTLPPDTIYTNGAGNFSVWLHRFHRYRGLGTQLAPTSGSMGYGVPAAVAAKLRHPDRTVVCLAGDGDFQLTMQELGTCLQHGVAVIFVVIDNGTYGTIRMHQERLYPGRVSGTDMVNPDFAALARAYGAHAEFVEETSAFGPAMERARASGRIALLHVRVDPEALTPDRTLSQIRGTQAQRDA